MNKKIGFGDFLLALGIVGIGLPTLFCLIFAENAFLWLKSNSMVGPTILIGSLVLILLGIIFKNIFKRKESVTNKDDQPKKQQAGKSDKN